MLADSRYRFYFPRSAKFMLALSRTTTRAAHRLSLHARAFSAVAHNAGSSDAAAAESLSGPAHHDNTAASRPRRMRLANSRAECMVVYPEDGIRSSAEGLAIARALQDKYGPAKEIIFPRVRHTHAPHTRTSPARVSYPSLVAFFFCSALVRRRLADHPTGVRMRQSLPLLLLARV